jgi:neprilysin
VFISFITIVPASEICTTKDCESKSRSILSKLDNSTNPCDNFHQHACGNFLKSQKVPQDFYKFDEWDLLWLKVEREINESFYLNDENDEIEAFKLSKNLYKACMDLESIKSRGIEPLQEIMDELGGWPVVKGDEWDENLISWQKVTEIANKKGFFYNFPVIFSTMQNTAKNPSQLMLQIASAKLPLHHKTYNDRENSTFQAYQSQQVEIAVLFGADCDKAETEMSDVLEFEISLSNVSFFSFEIDSRIFKFNLSDILDGTSSFGSFVKFIFIFFQSQ